MNENETRVLVALIIEKAKEYGADLAGISDVEALKKSPSHVILDQLPSYSGVGTTAEGKAEQGRVNWPETARSAVVFAIEHPEDQPELDWMRMDVKGKTRGNRTLMQINARLAKWLKKEKDMEARPLPYYIRQGGIFLKDAAVMAGLGCLGRNNMLVTPEYGPRVRIRAMLLDVALPSTGPVDFDPCPGCARPCQSVCPQKAFQERIYREEEFGLSRLPARNGDYARTHCNIQMELDNENAEFVPSEPDDSRVRQVKYCRRCEFSCPAGRG